ncbi:hypothetical protein [Sphingopyxis sp. BSNA05]|uniref:hypothetical protein n=1 Tax=Sphingopyxis sp. BSNA05 TaxID=1236614 RepID=UPI0015656AF4|nr:hypothetical protein [Sphingopyxis sp. BSNA05]
MNNLKRIRGLNFTVRHWMLLPALALTTACNSSLVEEAKQAEKDGRVISNEAMSALYPQSFRSGSPKYLERDFEAGADFICDEIKAKYQRDICSEEEINWRTSTPI